jgi:hypothetical protein
MQHSTKFSEKKVCFHLPSAVEPRLSELHLTETRVNQNAFFFCTRDDFI